MGLMPSASVGEHTSLYEPIHGSYPQATVNSTANPLATILSAAMMFEDALDYMKGCYNSSSEQIFGTRHCY
jgi:isocitrate/isopropylmalate dehydrogenase